MVRCGAGQKRSLFSFFFFFSLCFSLSLFLPSLLSSLSQMQLKAAVAFKDKERVTRTTIRLKDLFFEKNSDAFKFPKYGKLYPREAWADLKFLCMDREQLALGMLKHTKNTIHNSLTQIDEEDKITQGLAKAMFKNILGSDMAKKREQQWRNAAACLIFIGMRSDMLPFGCSSSAARC